MCPEPAVDAVERVCVEVGGGNREAEVDQHQPVDRMPRRVESGRELAGQDASLAVASSGDGFGVGERIEQVWNTAVEDGVDLSEYVSVGNGYPRLTIKRAKTDGE